MNEKAIFEIGDIIHTRYGKPYKFLIFDGTKLTPEKIIETYEYKQFKKQNPELCKLAEK